jgi:hypothetical protein
MMKSQGRQLLLFIIIVDLLIVLAIVGLRIIKSRQTVTDQLQTTSSTTSAPGLVVYGSIRSSTGAAVEDVTIFRSYAAYPGAQVGLTDKSGYYQSNFYAIPGDEMITVWAERSGMVFQPPTCSWRHYYGYEMKECNFIAGPGRSYYLPILSKSPR